MDLHLKDKVVVVTGGSAGIGKAIAMQYLGEGCKVVIGAPEPTLAPFLEECKTRGFSEVRAVAMDVSRPEESQMLLDKTIAAFNGLDIWINNAAVAIKRAMLMDLPLSEWDYLMNANLRGVLAACQVAARHMKDNGGGVIVNPASIGVRMPSAGAGAYAAAKAAVVTLTQVMAAELAPYNIRMFAFAPGLIETDMVKFRLQSGRQDEERLIALNRVGTPQEVASIIVMLSSDKASYYTGTALEISGGRLCVQNPHLPWEIKE